MERAHNFFAGPAILPFSVIEETRDAVYNFNNLGISILEISHRDKSFDAVIQAAQNDMLDIMGLSANDYSVIFVGGGASTQFAMLPLNFLKNKAEYVNTGEWASKAIKEAKRLGQVNVAASSEESKFNYIPKNIQFSDDVDYIHITTNNTIYGTEWRDTPNVKAPLVADMSSDFLSREMDYGKYSLIYGGAQKNLGPAGVTIVVINKNWLAENGRDDMPTMLNYKTHVSKESLYNTPPVLPIFTVGRVLKWIIREGGLAAIEARNKMKGGLIYDMIDAHPDFYKGTVVNKEDRSLMNITWNLPTPELEAKFVEAAKARKMYGLKGHRSVGGIRASVYNACPVESCEALVKLMEEFYNENK